MSDPALGLLPDFVGGAPVVRQPIRIIGVLVRIKVVVRVCGDDALCLEYRTVRAFARFGVEDLCTVGLQNSLALDRDVGGYAEGHAKAAGGTQHGIGDSGVAAGGIEQTLAAPHTAVAESLLHNAGGGPVFH